MKSILQEESSVLRAIEKAWNNAERPKEFTIKVLDEGDKNFLGMSRRPAIVSISYSAKQKSKNDQKAKRPKIAVVKNKKTKVETKKNEPVQKSKAPETTKKQKKEIFIPWNKDFTENIKIWLKELLEIMNIRSSFSIKPDKKFLYIYMDKHISRDPEEEKMVFISLSNLLLQFLKRKYKKKLNNYYLIINKKNRNDGKKKQTNTNK